MANHLIESMKCKYRVRDLCSEFSKFAGFNFPLCTAVTTLSLEHRMKCFSTLVYWLGAIKLGPKEGQWGCPFTELVFRVGFRVGFSSWIFKFDFELYFRLGFLSWLARLGRQYLSNSAPLSPRLIKNDRSKPAKLRCSILFLRVRGLGQFCLVSPLSCARISFSTSRLCPNIFPSVFSFRLLKCLQKWEFHEVCLYTIRLFPF